MIPTLGLRQYLMIGGGIILMLFAAWAWRVNDLRAHYKELAAAEKLAHAQTVANYTDAQKVAQERFDAQIKAAQLRNKELNDETIRRVADLSAQYNARVMRLPKAPACPASSTGMPEAGISESPEGRGSDTIILARSDALICADNTSRLQAAHDWALQMRD